MVLKEFCTADGRVVCNDSLSPQIGDVGRPIWIDLMEPSPEEELQVEAALGIDVPTLAEMQEIEASSRLYEEDGALFMTVSVLHKATTPMPRKARPSPSSWPGIPWSPCATPTPCHSET